MNININDSFLKDLENFSDEEKDKRSNDNDEEDIFNNKESKGKNEFKETYTKKIQNNNFNDPVDKLLNSTRLKNNNRFHEYLKDIENDIIKSKSNPLFYKNQNFKTTNV